MEKEGKSYGKKIKNAIQKIGEWIVNAWDVSKRYVTGSIFIMMVFTAIMSGILLLATSVVDGYATLQGYALMGTCFGTLLSIPLGLLFSFPAKRSKQTKKGLTIWLVLFVLYVFIKIFDCVLK